MGRRRVPKKNKKESITYGFIVNSTIPLEYNMPAEKNYTTTQKKTNKSLHVYKYLCICSLVCVCVRIITKNSYDVMIDYYKYNTIACSRKTTTNLTNIHSSVLEFMCLYVYRYACVYVCVYADIFTRWNLIPWELYADDDDDKNKKR